MADFNEIIKKHVGPDGTIPSSAIDAVVVAIKAAVGNEFVDKQRYKDKLNEVDILTTKAQTAEDNATTAGKWEDKYKTLKGDFDEYKTQQSSKETRSTKETAVRELLKGMGLSKDGVVKAIIKSMDVDGLELKDGAIVSVEKLTTDLKAEWADFIPVTNTEGTHIDNPITREPPKDTSKMTDVEYFSHIRGQSKK